MQKPWRWNILAACKVLIVVGIGAVAAGFAVGVLRAAVLTDTSAPGDGGKNLAAATLILVRQPVQIIRSGNTILERAHYGGYLRVGDRLVLGAGGLARVSFVKTHEVYKLTIDASAGSGTGSRVIDQQGTHLKPGPVTAGEHELPVTVTFETTIKTPEPAHLQVGDHIAPDRGGTGVRAYSSADKPRDPEDGDINPNPTVFGPEKPWTDAIADPTQSVLIQYKPAPSAPPGQTAVVSIYREPSDDPNGDPTKHGPLLWRSQPLTSEKRTVRLTAAELSAALMKPGRVYRWIVTLDPPNTDPHADGDAPLAGRLLILTKNDQEELQSDLQRIGSPQAWSDPEPALERALLFRHYHLWSMAAYAISDALGRQEDPDLRNSSRDILTREIWLYQAPPSNAQPGARPTPR